MTSHSTHCQDPYCDGCSCTPECYLWDEEPNVQAERERIIELARATWNELGAQQLGSVEFHDGIGYGIEEVIVAIMGRDEYLEQMKKRWEKK